MKLVLEETMDEIEVEIPPDDTYSGVTIRIIHDLEGIRIEQDGRQISFTAWRDIKCLKSR